jgi:hypothetical protein
VTTALRTATLELMDLFDVPPVPQHSAQNPVDAVTAILRAEGAPDPAHTACLAVEAIAGALHRRSGGSSSSADWLSAAVALRQP